MDNAGLQITISADVRDAILNLTDLTDATGELAVEGVGNLTAVNQALQALRAAQADTGNIGQLQQLNRAIGDLSSQASQLKKAGTEGFDELGNSIKNLKPPIQDAGSTLQQLGLNTGTARTAFLDLGRIVTGQGFTLRSLASNFSLLGPAATIGVAAIYGLYEVLTKQTDAEQKASEEAKKLHDILINLQSASDITLSSTGSEAGNIAQVQALAAAIQNTNNTYAERNNALQELRETNKAYFGDLTLEASSMATLSARVHDYSQALVTEAVVKGQVDAIAKTSEALQKQVEVLNQLRDARARLQNDQAHEKKLPTTPGSAVSGGADVLSGGGDETDAALARVNGKLQDQEKVVLDLRTAIASYTGALNQNIALQIQQKPLKGIPSADDLKSIIPVLEQIQRIYDDLSKPSKEPLFKQNDLSIQANNPSSNTAKLLQSQIQEAFANGVSKGADDPRIAAAYNALGHALQAKLSAEQNPDLTAHFAFQVADPSTDVFAKMESTVEKLFGNKTLEIKVPTHLLYDIEATKKFSEDDSKKINEQLEKDPAFAHMFVNATADIKVSIGRAIINTEEMQKTLQLIQKQIVGVAESGFKDIGELIGDALTGAKDPVGKAIKDFTTVLGNGLITIGEQMIAASTLMTLLKETLGNLFTDPIGGIVEGIAAVALGEVVKNVGAKAFATGGIITGPTLGLIGEAGPEVVFPLDRLNQFVKSNQGGGNQPVQVYGTIRGRDIAIASARDSKLQGMTS